MNAISQVSSAPADPHTLQISKYREQILARRTKPWIYIAISFASFSLLLLALLLFSEVQPILGILSAATSLAILGFSIPTLRSRDAALINEAALTPIATNDLERISAQLSAVHHAYNTLLGVWPGQPLAIKGAIGLLYQAIEPLMSLNGITVQTAAVDGYPAYPEIARTSMIDDDADYVSFHVMRLGASLERLHRHITATPALIEPVAAAAGEFVPPLRAMKAEVERNT